MAWTKIKSGGKADVAILTLSEVTANDSSKELTITDVGSAGFFELMGVRIEFTATATVGTRTIVFQILSATDDVLHEMAIDANTVTAGNSGTWELHANAPTDVTTPQYVHMPYGMYIFSGQKLLIEDSAAIDAAADDMVLHVTGKAYYAKAV
jgi:hypothetical protein